MLRSLRLVDFKSFQDVRIPFGPFTLLVGTNASGKSNVQDALRFLHGCAQGFTLAEVMDEKWGPGGLLLWRGIRGGAREIIRGSEGSFQISCAVETAPQVLFEYSIAVALHKTTKAPGFLLERWTVNGRPSFDRNFTDQRLRTPSSGYPALTRISENPENEGVYSKRVRAEAQHLVTALKSIRFLDLMPDAMRNAATPGQQILGDRGENLSAVLYNITLDHRKKDALLGWLRSLTPLDVVDLRFREDLTGRVLVYLVESNGRETSAQSASDGTLRFLALAAALLSSESGNLFFIEELDNGLHPTRLHLLLDVIEQATRSLGCQVVATTHNPQVLAYLSDKAREDAVLLYRREQEDASEAIRILDLPDVHRILESQDLGRLFATGWLEDAVSFQPPKEEPAPRKRLKRAG